jgi:hypothetical protein
MEVTMQAAGESSPSAYVRLISSPVSSGAGGNHTMHANNVNLTILDVEGNHGSPFVAWTT